MADSKVNSSSSSNATQMDEVLHDHRKEMFQKLDVWLQRVEVMLQEHMKAPQVGPDAEEAVMSRQLSIVLDTKKRRPSLNSSRKETGLISSETSDAGDGQNSAELARIVSQERMQAREAEEETPIEVKDLEGWQKLKANIGAIVNSHASNAFFAVVVLTNSLYLGIQLEYHAVTKDASADALFLYIHLIYAVLFTVEVGLRLLADGFFKYFCASEWAWNLLDVFIVSSSWIELIIDVLTPGTSETPNRGTNTNLRLIRLLRVGRLFRVVRIIRVVRLFRSLRTLVQSLVGTLKTLFWALLLLFLIMQLFMSSDFFCVAGENSREDVESDNSA